MAEWQQSPLSPSSYYDDDEFDDLDDDEDYEEDPYEEVGAKLVQTGRPVEGYMEYTYDVSI